MSNDSQHTTGRATDDPYRVVGKYVHKQAKKMRSRLAGAAEADDVEHVHKARTASRRLRSALKVHADVFGSKAKSRRKKLKGLTKALGDARDADVQILTVEKDLDHPPDEKSVQGLRRLLLRLGQHRRSLQPSVAREVEKIQNSDVLDKIDTRAKTLRGGKDDDEADAFYARCAEEIASQVEKLCDRSPALAEPGDHRGHHKMRITAKKLRYALESIAGAYDGQLDEYVDQAEDLQDLLGSMHDHVVFVELLDDFLRSELEREKEFFGHADGFGDVEYGIIKLRQRHLDAREADYARSVEMWDRHRQQQTWRRLTTILGEWAEGRCSAMTEESLA